MTRHVQKWQVAGAMLMTLGAAGLMAGCGGVRAGKVAEPIVAAARLAGSVHGGQQPVTGATIQIYAATFTGYGAAATPLLNPAVMTDSSGAFNVTSYSCPSATTPVYVVATGGSAGSIGSNSGIALMAAIGPCSALDSASVNINELTTVASAYALSPFMTSAGQLSTSPGNAAGMKIAFASAPKLVNATTGALPGNALPAGALEPLAELNTLADILAACINSTTGSAACSTLFSNTTVAGMAAPADTISAVLNIAKNPSSNVQALFNLTSATGPFMPTLAVAPTDFTVAIKYAAGSGLFNNPSAAAINAAGDVWVTNSGSNTITVVDAISGMPNVYSGGGLNAPAGIAFDVNGDAWVTEKGSSQLSVFTPSGSGAVTAASGLSSPTGVALNAQGTVFVTNAGNSSITMNVVSGTTVNSSTALSTGGVSSPVGLAISSH